MAQETSTKFCKHCGEIIPSDAVICTKCGRQVEVINMAVSQQPQIVINNDNNNVNANANINKNTNAAAGGRLCNKWVSLCLCIFLGYFGAHKFYEGKGVMGIIYLLTGGLFFVGWFVDIFLILSKPNPYYA